VDILVSLALEPPAIEAVLKELRTYIRSPDKKFVTAAIRAVGRVAELARIVYDRHGQKSKSALQERQKANRIALDCLYGLAVVTQAGDSQLVVGEAVCVMQSILTMLLSDAGNEPGSLQSVEDPNEVQNFALRRILLLLVNALATRSKKLNKNNDDDDEDGSENDEEEPSDLEKVSLALPQHAVASALWIVGDWLISSYSALGKVDENTKSKMRFEIVRLVDRTFPEMSLAEKCQAIHFCTKVLLLSSSVGSGTPSALCEHVLSMGRIDIHPDVKDQARMESAIIQASIGLKHDTDNMDSQPAMGAKLTVDTAKRLLLAKKPAPSYLPVEDDIMADKRSFRFGTLSSLVGHQARGAYLPLPPWNEKNSPKALRDPIETVKQQVSGVPASSTPTRGAPGFYGKDESSDSSDDDSSSNDDSSSSDSASGDQNDADSESESESDDNSSSSSDDNKKNMLVPNSNAMGVNRNMASNPNNNMMGMNLMQQPMGKIMETAPAGQSNHMASSDGDSSSSDDSSSSSSDDDYQGDISSANLVPSQEGNLLSMGGPLQATTNAGFGPGSAARSGSSSSAMDDLRGLVMAPIAIDESKASDPDMERDSSGWTQLVRPEVGGGLSVRVRFLRGPTKAREAQLKGLNPKLPNVVCVQVQFGNK
jgi:AP-3 complex subunit beta